MTTRYVGINGSGTGDGSTWGNAPAAYPTGLATVHAASSPGDLIKIEAGVHPPVSLVNWSKKVDLKGETRGGVDAKAILTGTRTTPWPVNGVWKDGATVGGVTYPTLTPGNAGENCFIYKAAAAASGGSTFSWLAFRNVGTPIKPALGSAGTLGAVTVHDVVTFNTNGLVYIDANTDGQCNITATDCRSTGYSEGMFRAFGDEILTRCHGDALNQFHSPTTNLFGCHCQDAIAGVTLVKYNVQFVQCSFINHAAAAPAGSSKDPAVTGNYAQGDGFVAEENTNWLPSYGLVAWGNADRGIDLKCAIPAGNLRLYHAINNGYSIAAHDDTVETWVTDSFLGTTFRPSYDSDKSAPIQASGHLNVDRCVIEQRHTPVTNQYIVAYGSVQAAHTQSGVTVPQRVGQIIVQDSLINMKTGTTKMLMSAGGSPVATPTYFESNTLTVNV